MHGCRCHGLRGAWLMQGENDDEPRIDDPSISGVSRSFLEKRFRCGGLDSGRRRDRVHNWDRLDPIDKIY